MPCNLPGKIAISRSRQSCAIDTTWSELLQEMEFDPQTVLQRDGSGASRLQSAIAAARKQTDGGALSCGRASFGHVSH